MRFLERCLARYGYAQRHIHLGMDEGGNCYLALPAHLLAGHGRPGEPQLAWEDIVGDALPQGSGELFSSGPFRAYRLSPYWRTLFESRGWSFRPGLSRAIGGDLRLLPLSFCPPPPQGELAPYADILLPLLAEILASPTPRLAAVCALLDHNFHRLTQFVETGIGQGRQVAGVAGILVDMHGFQQRDERFFVPWRAVVPDRDRLGRTSVLTLGQAEMFRRLSELSVVAA